DLGAIDEVATLRFPNSQRGGFGRSIAVLECQNGFFGQHRIDDRERSSALGDDLPGDIRTTVPALALLVVQHRVSVRTRAPTRVLPSDAYGVSASDQGSVGQVLAHAPIDILLAARHVATVVKQLVDQRVDGKAFGNRGELL